MTLVQVSFLAGLFGALAWLVGDILLVGFAPVTEEDLVHYQAGGVTNLRLALYMRSGTDRRLRWGVWLAQFSIWLPLLSLYGFWQMAQPVRGLAWAGLLCLLIGFSLSPLAHGAFYVIAILGKAYCQDYAEAGKANKFLVEALNQANHLLNVTWLSALVITYLGWALYGLAIVTGQTQWPTYFLLATPLVTTPIWLGLSHYVIRRWTPLFNGAALNLAWVSFYVLALWLVT
ncbi:DUF6796 family protein [Abiotrophia sp.]|uniref:DUF6796 family protein n=1 Tax=Abiotrophia sp. TaxID=76631 RepID=UPI001CB41AC8|nr:DUF6796 family protein [Abiotrophia sp.]MBF0940975.1 beta-carotene 15,15'-monooxygenase [Abiotrophia sp.]